MPEKVVDFKKLLDEYKNRAENKLSYTIQQVDDVVFIDNKHIVALEYIFWSAKNGNYHRLVKQKVETGDENSTDKLGLKNYNKGERSGLNAFCEVPRVYHVLK